MFITATQIQKETNSFLYKYKYSWKNIGSMKGVALIRGYPLQCADTNRQSPMHVDTTRAHQRKTLIFIGVSQRYFFARPLRFQKPNSLIILWPVGDGISLETSKNLQLVGELIYNRLATRCFWERCQDLQNTTQRRCTLWLVTCWPDLLYYLHASPS